MGDIRYSLKLNLTSNGYKRENNEDGDAGIQYERTECTGIFTLHQAYVRGGRGIILAIERDGCCHLISTANGRLSKLQSIDSIVPRVIDDKCERVVLNVTATGNKGQFIVGGWRWTKLISVKLK